MSAVRAYLPHGGQFIRPFRPPVDEPVNFTLAAPKLRTVVGLENAFSGGCRFHCEAGNASLR